MALGFADRRAAGQELGRHLGHYADRQDVVVLGLPRGGMPVAFEVASALAAPLDVFVVRKLGVPGHEELAMGAIASGGVRVLNRDVLALIEIGSAEIAALTARERRELELREQLYRGERTPIDVTGRTTVVVDDGLATGATMRAAIAALRERRAAAIVVAVPIASPDTCAELAPAADELICARTPEPFMAVGLWYEDFSATSDEEVRALLEASARAHETPTSPGG
jgi:predicted phosphoribosyltransferase